MASALTIQHIKANNSIQMWDHDPDTASAIVVTPDGGTTDRWVDMKDFAHFAVAAMTTVVSSGALTKLEILASDASDGSTNVTVVKDSGTVSGDAQGDWVIEECTADEIAQLSSEAALAPGAGLRYVAGRLTMSNSGSEAAVLYIRCGGRAYSALTPATTIS